MSSGGFNLGDLLPLIIGGLGAANSFGFGGSGLTSALTGIPPQELNLLQQEGQLMGPEITQANMRNNVIGALFPQFMNNTLAVNPFASQQYINQADVMGQEGAQNIRTAGIPLADALQYIRQASGPLDVAQQSLFNMVPDIGTLRNTLEQFMNLGSPYYQQHQTAAMQENAQKFNDLSGQLRGTLNQAGFGASPTGLATAAQGDLARQAGQSMSQAYLQNLFQNENLQLSAAGMFPAVPQLENVESQGLQGIAQGRLAQGQGMTSIGGQDIAQGLGMANVGNLFNQAGQLSQGQQGLQLGKGQALSPAPFFANFPRMPNFPVNVGALPSMGTKGNGGGGGHWWNDIPVIGGLIGGIASLF